MGEFFFCHHHKKQWILAILSFCTLIGGIGTILTALNIWPFNQSHNKGTEECIVEYSNAKDLNILLLPLVASNDSLQEYQNAHLTIKDELEKLAADNFLDVEIQSCETHESVAKFEGNNKHVEEFGVDLIIRGSYYTIEKPDSIGYMLKTEWINPNWSSTNFPHKKNPKQKIGGVENLIDSIYGPISDQIFWCFGIIEKNRKNFSKAIEHLERISIKTQNEHLRIPFLIGAMNTQLERDKDALKYLSICEEKGYNLELVWGNIGAVYANLGKKSSNDSLIKLAIKFHKKSLDLSPKSDTVLTNIGVCYSLLNDLKRAQFYLEKAVNINPRNSTAQGDLGFLYMKNNEQESAFNQYTIALNLDSLNANVWLNRSIYFLKNGRFQEALNDLNKGVSVDSSYVDIWLNRGYIYNILGQYQNAENDFSQAIALNPNEKFLNINRAFVRISLNYPELAMEDILEAENAFGDSFVFYACRSRYFILKGDLISAESDILHAISLEPRVGELSKDLAKIKLKRGDTLGYYNQLANAFSAADPFNPNDIFNDDFEFDKLRNDSTLKIWIEDRDAELDGIVGQRLYVEKAL